MEARASVGTTAQRAPRGRRHLAAVAPPTVDRSEWSFLAYYPRFVLPYVPEPGARGKAASEPGWGMSPLEALVFSAIINAIGTRADGRLGSSTKTFSVSAASLQRTLGRSEDEIQAATEALAGIGVARYVPGEDGKRVAIPRRPMPCPLCRRAHAVLAITRTRGRSNTYTLVRCDTPGVETFSVEDVLPPKRSKTGGVPVLVPELEELPLLARLESTGDSPVLRPDAEPPVVVAARPAHAVSLGIEAMEAMALTPDGELEVRTILTRAMAVMLGVPISDATAVTVAEVTDDPAVLADVLISVAIAARGERVPTRIEIAGLAQDASARLLALVNGDSPAVRPAAVRVSLANRADLLSLDWVTAHIATLVASSARKSTAKQVATCARALLAAVAERFDDADTQAYAVKCALDRKDLATSYKGPVAFITGALKSGGSWLFERDDESGDGRLRSAFEKLNPGEQVEIERCLRDAAAGGAPLDRARLATLGVQSRPMFAYLARRFGLPETPRT